MSITCGIDWAEAHHDVAVVDNDGKVVARARVGTDVAGFAAVLELIVEHGGSPDDTPVAIETDKNLVVVALAGAGFSVYPINPRAVARYRQRHSQAGGKSDPGDAAVLANILRTDRHMHRPLPVISEQALAIKALARQHQEAIWAMNQTISRLRSVLLEFYPQAIKAFPHLKHHAATTILAVASTPGAGQKLTRRRVEALLHRCGRRNDTRLVDQILADLKTPALRQSERVEAALGLTVEGLVQIITAIHHRHAALGGPARGRAWSQVRDAPSGTRPTLGTRPRTSPRRPRARRGRRRPAPIHHRQWIARLRRNGTRDPRLRALSLRQGPEGP